MIPHSIFISEDEHKALLDLQAKLDLNSTAIFRAALRQYQGVQYGAFQLTPTNDIGLSKAPATLTAGSQPSTDQQLAALLIRLGWEGNHNTWTHPSLPEGTSYGWLAALEHHITKKVNYADHTTRP